jgi:hypothetical protein
MARIAPQVQALRTRYRRQPERFQRELTALYQREGTHPLSGLWPLLAQWPFLSVMYLLFRSGTVHGAPNQLLSDGLFGVPLGAHWLSGGLLSVHDVLFLGVFAVLAALCWLSARLAKRVTPAAVAETAGGSGPSPAAGSSRRGRSPADGSSGRGGAGRRQAAGGRTGNVGSRGGQAGRAAGQGTAGRQATRTRAADSSPDPAEVLANSKAAGVVTRVLPYVTVVIAAFAPLAAAIYLLTTVGWTLAERRLFLRRALPPGSTGPAGSTGPEGSTDFQGSPGSQGSRKRAAGVTAPKSR